MKWIKGQLWCMAGAIIVAMIMTGYFHTHPTSHGFRATLILSSVIIGILLGLKEGTPALVWILYSYAASILFGILSIQPFASHDVPLSIVAAYYALYSAPTGFIGALIGIAALYFHRKRKMKAANKRLEATGDPLRGSPAPQP